MSDRLELGNDDVHIAAAVLCLLEPPDPPIAAMLDGLAPPDQLARLETQLAGISREDKLTVLANPLARLALSLTSWRIQ